MHAHKEDRLRDMAMATSRLLTAATDDGTAFLRTLGYLLAFAAKDGVAYENDEQRPAFLEEGHALSRSLDDALEGRSAPVLLHAFSVILVGLGLHKP